MMAVSALEPLAKQHSLGPEVAQAIDELAAILARKSELPAECWTDRKLSQFCR